MTSNIISESTNWQEESGLLNTDAEAGNSFRLVNAVAASADQTKCNFSERK